MFRRGIVKLRQISTIFRRARTNANTTNQQLAVVLGGETASKFPKLTIRLEQSRLLAHCRVVRILQENFVRSMVDFYRGDDSLKSLYSLACPNEPQLNQSYCCCVAGPRPCPPPRLGGSQPSNDGPF
jgi:hypothetical protein